MNPLLDLAGSTAPNDDFWEPLEKGSGQEAELPKINFATNDLLGFFGSDKNSIVADKKQSGQ